MIENRTGTGKIQIRYNDLGSYLWVNRPVALSWYDNNGSIGKYLCLFPWSQEYRKIIFREIQENLYLDYSNSHSKLGDNFQWLFDLLGNGNYYINFIQQMEANLAYNRSLYNSSEVVFNEHSKMQHLIPNINRTYTNEGFYDGTEIHLVFTQPTESIDRSRVDYFKQELKQGKRPAPIILSTQLFTEHKDIKGYNSQVDFETSFYILDGHHKLIAYKELAIKPNVIHITKKEIRGENEFRFDTSDLKKYLFNYQLDHIEKHLKK